MRPSEILKLKRAEVLQIAEKYGVKNIRVFGSVARGEDDEKSDVDLLAEFPEGTTYIRYFTFVHELEKILSCKVDIVSQIGLKPRIREIVMREVLPIREII
jgi:predicted nucleotidyltransferase